jgi:6-phosphogluconolactonase
MEKSEPEIRVAEDIQELSQMAAKEFVVRALEAVVHTGVFAVALSGGLTPIGLFDLLANPTGPYFTQVPWKSSYFFWGDERHVPPDHPQSNYHMAHEKLLSKVPVPPENVHRIRAEDPDASRAAENYGTEIKEFFHLQGDEWPRFSLILLGLGADGHTASLFPGASILQENKRLVSAEWIEKHESYRISMTPPVINHAASVAFLVSGAEKAGIVREVIRGELQPHKLPAQLIQPENGKLLWFLDRSAADQLSG